MTKFVATCSIAVVALAAGCASPLNTHPVPGWIPIPEPAAADVDAVVFLAGDIGEATFETSPVLQRMRIDIDDWSQQLARDSVVAAVILGDNIYPVGMHPRGHPEFHHDSLVLRGQAEVVGGENARRYHAAAYFIPGNHDWAIRGGPIGELYLANQAAMLTAFRNEEGLHVRMLPPAGTGGPGVVDVGRNFRMILLDTAWWPLTKSAPERSALMIRLERLLRTRGDRIVMMAAHHPFESGGAHGEGLVPVWKTLGIKYFLAKSGAVLQNLNSVPFREFRIRMMEIFNRVGPPLIFAGGHEHSLQVIRDDIPGEPRYGFVAGSGSKLTDVGYVAGQLYRRAAPGYVRLMIKKDGSVSAFVIALPEDYLLCNQADASARARCISEGIAAAKVDYSVEMQRNP